MQAWVQTRGYPWSSKTSRIWKRPIRVLNPNWPLRRGRSKRSGGKSAKSRKTTSQPPVLPLKPRLSHYTMTKFACCGIGFWPWSVMIHDRGFCALDSSLQCNNNDYYYNIPYTSNDDRGTMTGVFNWCVVSQNKGQPHYSSLNGEAGWAWTFYALSSRFLSCNARKILSIRWEAIIIQKCFQQKRLKNCIIV